MQPVKVVQSGASLNRKGHMESICKFRHLVYHLAIVLRNSNKRNPFRGPCFFGRYQHRYLLVARTAPGSPEIEHGGSTTIRLKRNLVAGQIAEFQINRLIFSSPQTQNGKR